MNDQTIFQMYFYLAKLRASLYRAMDEGNAAQAEALSAQIDALQMERWQDEKPIKMPG